jgi:hypothetical protein
MNISQLIERLTNLQNQGFGEKDVKFRNCANSGKISSVDYILHDKNTTEIVLCEEWF